MDWIFYILSMMLSLYVGVSFFRTWNLNEIDKSDSEMKAFAKANNIPISYMSYRDRIKFVPIGLKVWLLFLIILISSIPIINLIIDIIIIIIVINLMIDNGMTFEQVFNRKVPKIITFFNKKL